MSRYLAISLSPSGLHCYLAQGKLERRAESAKLYEHPSGAWRAIEGFLSHQGRDPRDYRFDVIDTRTGKSQYGTADGIYQRPVRGTE